MTFLDNFCEQVKKRANDIAIVDHEGMRAITYKELDILSSRVASKLMKCNICEDSNVLVRIGRCSEYIAAELGILKAGCAIVPLIMEYPKERVSYIQNDCKSEIIIDSKFFLDINEFASEIVIKKTKNNALIVYTSGSTGKPKGVVYSAKEYDAAIDRLTTHFTNMDEIVLGAVAPMSFVAHLFEFAAVLAVGGCSHIISEEVRRDVQKMENYYKKFELSCGYISPRMLALFRNKDKKLKKIITGSERVSNVQPGEYEIVVSYAQTEAMDMLRFTLDDIYENTPVGKAVPGTKVTLIDETGEEVSMGEEGEICVQGIYPSQYLNLPQASKEHFKKLHNGETIIYTGDIGKMLPDGNIIYMNRKDWMVKINGHRVEPGEIERAMKEIVGVTGVAVKDYTSANGHIYLCGYYVSNRELEKNEIREQLEKKLPDYMIPSVFMELKNLPLNVNGKLDRASLPIPKRESLQLNYKKPVTSTEIALCNIVSKLLKIKKVGIEDDFFELGGDSLYATQLAVEISAIGNGDISATDVYRFPVVEKLAEYVSKRKIGNEDIFCYSEGKKDRTPLFFVHSANTGPESYRKIAEKIPKDIPFYCFDNHNLSYQDIEIRTIEKIAKYYIYQMRSVCPKGPYLLGGWSMGATVAFEMALQLEKQGEEVLDLILMDPLFVKEKDKEAVLAQSVDPNLEKYFQEEEVFKNIRGGNGSKFLFENNKRVAKDMAEYKPNGIYKGKVLFLKATEVRKSDFVKGLCINEKGNGFGQFCNEMEISEFECNHDEIVSNKKAIELIDRYIRRS